jgi:starch phosphorylase
MSYFDDSRDQMTNNHSGKRMQKNQQERSSSANDEEYFRTGFSIDSLRRSLAENLFYTQGKHPATATFNDLYMATAYTVRDRLLHRALDLIDTFIHKDFKIACYFSAEFLIGPQLGNHLVNLGIYASMEAALKSYGISLEKILEHEVEPGLGNGGLGRLAACFLDSLATLEIPSIGYGIRYEFGLFQQDIKHGWQVERTDKWLNLGNPWEIARPSSACYVHFGGHTEGYVDPKGKYRVRWNPDKVVKGIPYDTLVSGYKVNTCNALRLWQAQATESFDFAAFNVGDYYKAVDKKIQSENITKILYPNDEPLQGKQLRLEQQYFFVSCSLQNMIQIHLKKHPSLDNFQNIFAVQLNDTHPSIAIAEFMRLLIDYHDVEWEKAWDITQKTFAYTNHTLLPEALEKWPVDLFRTLLPRHLEIIYEINQRFLGDIKRRYPGDTAKIQRMSLIEESTRPSIRMANLACLGSHSTNGVAALHTQLLKKYLFPDFVQIWPERFINITNGVTPRRFLLLSNPRLSQLIQKTIGSQWIRHLEDLQHLEAYARDQNFQKEWQDAKLENKKNLSKYIKDHTKIIVNPNSLFDIQVKRIHEYKRQNLNLLHIVTLYNRLRKNPNLDMVPRTFCFSGKAAPSYFMAKLTIKLITAVAKVINNDPLVQDLIKVVFIPNFSVKNAQLIYPAADLSEQISTAGKEASGTGNMKFAMNGALTIGTLDGANVEIRQKVGANNFFLFGLTVEQIDEWRKNGYYPRNIYEQNAELREAIDLIRAGCFCPENKSLFHPLIDSLLDYDPYMVLGDYSFYIECQRVVDETYRKQDKWQEMSILNVARIGYFSSDRAIKQYSQEIWKTTPLPIYDADLVMKRK